MMKRLISCLFAVLLCMLSASAAFAANGTDKAHLLNLYADGMLFRQNAPAIFAGTAQGVSEIRCELRNAAGEVVAKAKGPVNKSNRFSVAFTAPKGGYETYTVELYADGTPFATLRNIVFGELWLASGQSNMDFPLGQSAAGQKMMETGETGSAWLRFYRAPTYPVYQGREDLYPVDPQSDIEGGLWYDGTSPQIYSTSAVAFFFAQKMQQTLDMPFGVLQSSLGGSSIYSWLSRDAIETDAAVRADLVEQDAYFPEETWSESGHNTYIDMTVNYNKKMSALRVFRPVGMIWYQGETEIFRDVTPDAYARAFDCMQRCFSEQFGFADGERMPIVYTQLVSYNYTGSSLQRMNDGFARMQTLFPNVRAVTPIYDVPKDYTTASGYIHPSVKKPVGERMAYAAAGLVYDVNKSTCSAAYPVKTEVRDGSVYVTLSHSGNGLAVKGTRLYGFAVSGADGYYVPAEAQIVSTDTVRICADTVPSPAAASYAFAQTNDTANLYATDENGLAMPVSPFITDPEHLQQAWQSKDWTSCDFAEAWHTVDETNTGFYDTWAAQNAAVSFTDDGMCGSALHVQANAKRFTVQPVLQYSGNGKTKMLPDCDRDFRHYSAISFYVRNTGKADVRLDAVRFYTSRSTWYAPAVNGTDDPDCVIPADGSWHEVTLDMDALYLFGNECGVTLSRKKLQTLRDLQLRFSGTDASLDIDEFRFTPDGARGHAARFTARFAAADNVWEAFCAFWMLLLSPLNRILP